MSTISANQSSQTYATQRPPPSSEKSRLASAIGSEVSTGAISPTDATALTSALEAIDQSLASDRTARPSSSTARLDPSAMKDRIDGLIADQVSGGALTSDQADTLKELFAQQGGEGGPDGSMGGAGGPGRAGGPPPGPPPGGMQGGPDDAASSSTSSTSGNSASDLLASFIEQLKAAQSSGTRYAASGQSAGAQASALLFDFTS